MLTLTPGVDTAMVLRSATTGPRSAAFAALGIGLGCLIWGGAVSLGLGALLAASETAFTIVKWAGAAYLLYLGVGLLMKPRAALAVGSATAVLDIELHQSLGHKAHHLAHDIVGAGLLKQLGKLHAVLGHRGLPHG